MATNNRLSFLQKLLSRVITVNDVRDSIIPLEQKFQLILKYLTHLKTTQLKADLSDMFNQFGITLKECQLIEGFIAKHDMDGLRSIIDLLCVTNPDDLTNCLVNVVKDITPVVQ